jgi:hypothetical protein
MKVFGARVFRGPHHRAVVMSSLALSGCQEQQAPDHDTEIDEIVVRGQLSEHRNMRWPRIVDLDREEERYPMTSQRFRARLALFAFYTSPFSLFTLIRVPRVPATARVLSCLYLIIMTPLVRERSMSNNLIPRFSTCHLLKRSNRIPQRPARALTRGQAQAMSTQSPKRRKEAWVLTL